MSLVIYSDQQLESMAKRLNELFDYKDGELYWKQKISDKVNIGKKAGSKTNDRYRVRFDGIVLLLHRAIFLMKNGWLPDEVDHIDCNPINNRIENLRPSTRVQNVHNTRKPVTNTSGYKNVEWQKGRNKWRVSIDSCGKDFHIGYYDDIGLAVAVSKAAREYLHGEFARHE